MADRVRFGLNRWNFSSAPSFALDVKAGEEAGWDLALIPSSPLLLADPYIMLTFAARGTNQIGLGPFVETPVLRHPAVLASSIATLDELAPERALLTLGSGDTAVRLLGKEPATVAELEAATNLTRQLLAGDEMNSGTREAARMEHARPVPVWVAAGGLKTLRMAGRAADVVDFLTEEAIDAFMVYGSASEIRDQLRAVLELDLGVSTIVVHRLPGGGSPPSGATWKDEFAREVIEQLEPITVD
ncbi:MAG: LLM class flavin-dependent oxidoreductase [Dehalococcoidia bacterium]|jgi:5,10-methylenetetrahydromethanopterin reductase|nr:LLM class flavin-dependent oxidoreductase [Dehalococcoidia bacterium]